MTRDSQESSPIAKRYLTDELPGIRGSLKQRPEDFLVEELPLYQPSGEGEHIYLFIEKRLMSTMELVRVVARHFGVHPRDVGIAGLKDKKALTRQVVSVHTPGKRLEDFGMLDDNRVGVLWTDYHNNKLRRGHLAGNRFSLRIRDVKPTDVRHALDVMRILESQGVPNRLGAQRFGSNGTNHLVGRAIMLEQHEQALDHMLAPDPHDDDPPLFRTLYAQGDYEGALLQLPRALDAERAALRVLARGGEHARAIRAVGSRAIEFFVTAAQSAVFNSVLDARLEARELGTLRSGDIAQIHANGACFAVDGPTESSEETSSRLEAFEISATGPMWGPEMMRASGETDEEEIRALESFGMTIDDVANSPAAKRGLAQGTRRPLRVAIEDADIEGGVDEHGPFVRLAFTLPRGAFATIVAEEVMKVERASEGD